MTLAPHRTKRGKGKGFDPADHVAEPSERLAVARPGSGLKGAVYASRLGKCWKCMSISVGLLITSLCLTVVFSGFDDNADHTLFMIALVASIVFGLLTLTHFVVWVLRKTSWQA